jgi:hypothetical protein
MMFLFEGHCDVCISRADEAGGGVHEIDAAIWQSNVAENVVRLRGWDVTADRVLDEVSKPRGLLNARAGFGSQVQDELAAI